MARTLMKALAGKAALAELLAWDMPDWQARQVLETARNYGECTIPVEAGYSTLTITRDENGGYLIGGYFRGRRHP